MLSKNSIVYSSRAPIGYIGIAKNELCTNQGCKSLSLYNEDLLLYVYYSLIQRTPEIQSRASGTTFKEISGGEFALTVIPLPPLEEQKRIVAKIEKLMNYVDRLNKIIDNKEIIDEVVEFKSIEENKKEFIKN